MANFYPVMNGHKIIKNRKDSALPWQCHITEISLIGDNKWGDGQKPSTYWMHFRYQPHWTLSSWELWTICWCLYCWAFLWICLCSDASGEGLYGTLLENLQEHNLNIPYCFGQSYNGSKIMEIDTVCSWLPKHCVPCSSHTLDLVMADPQWCPSPSLVFCRDCTIYSIHLCSTGQYKGNMWSNSLRNHQQDEARIDSVKVVRYQLPEILQASSALQSIAVEDSDTAKSLHDELMPWHFVLCTIIWLCFASGLPCQQDSVKSKLFLLKHSRGTWTFLPGALRIASGLRRYQLTTS